MLVLTSPAVPLPVSQNFEHGADLGAFLELKLDAHGAGAQDSLTRSLARW